MTIITHINDVLPHVEGRTDFAVKIKDDYTVIDYIHTGEKDVFDNPYRLECRGLKFCNETGKILARPFHKFFNYGEKQEHSDIDWSRPHVIMDKLDGSMIHPCMVNGEVRFMTRAGITDHSERCEELHLTDEIRLLCKEMLDEGLTPIFEWTAPENRIVVEYKKTELTLLAIRYTEEGKYSTECLKNALFFIPVKTHKKNSATISEIESMKRDTGIEGYVIRFLDNDQYIKIKTDEYVSMHRAVSYFESEKAIIEIVLDDKCDDLYPALSIDRAHKLREYETAVNLELVTLANIIEEIVNTAKQAGVYRKAFALEIASQADSRIRSVYFNVLDGKNAVDSLKVLCKKDNSILSTRWLS